MSATVANSLEIDEILEMCHSKDESDIALAVRIIEKHFSDQKKKLRMLLQPTTFTMRNEDWFWSTEYPGKIGWYDRDRQVGELYYI